MSLRTQLLPDYISYTSIKIYKFFFLQKGRRGAGSQVMYQQPVQEENEEVDAAVWGKSTELTIQALAS